MHQMYLLIGGLSAPALFRTGSSTSRAAQALRENSRKLKTLTRLLVEEGMPLRHILLPYVDTVLLDERTDAYFFGGRMLLYGENSSGLSGMVKRVLTAMDSHDLRISKPIDREECTKLLRQRAPTAAVIQRRLPPASCCPAAGQLVYYTFPAGRGTVLPQNPMQCRAMARSILAFGDILGRTVRKAGGEILRCAEDELICVWPEKEPEDLIPVLQQTYAAQLAPVLGGEPQMKRTVYVPNE